MPRSGRLEDQAKQQMLQAIGSDQPAPKPGAAAEARSGGITPMQRKDLDRLIEGNQVAI